ncbi:MAG: hypothetical protein V4492_00455 [Chlamydiota bacterium]
MSCYLDVICKPLRQSFHSQTFALSFEDPSPYVTGDGSTYLAYYVPNFKGTEMAVQRRSIWDTRFPATAVHCRLDVPELKLGGIWKDVRSDGCNRGLGLGQVMRSSTTITTLILDNNRLRPEAVTEIGEALQVNATLKTLKMVGNNLGTHAQPLVSALLINHTLVSLNLSFNSLREEEGENIALMLNGNRCLAHLILAGNSLGNRGAEAIAGALTANSTLTELDLSRNTIEEKGGIELGISLLNNSSLTVLHIGGNDFKEGTARALSHGLRINSTVEILSLRDVFFDPDADQLLISALAINTRLREVVVPHWEAEDATCDALLDALASNASLTSLGFGSNDRFADRRTKAKQVVERLATNAWNERLRGNSLFYLLFEHLECELAEPSSKVQRT